VAWRIRFTKEADESLRKLDRQVSARILDELEEVSKLDDPRSRGKALVGNRRGSGATGLETTASSAT
jgi:mRNA interferase RelE/StbE